MSQVYTHAKVTLLCINHALPIFIGELPTKTTSCIGRYMYKRVYLTCYSLTFFFNLVGAYIVGEYSFRIILQLNDNHTSFGSSINARGLVFSTFNYHFWPLRSQPMVLIYNSYIEGLNYFFCYCVINILYVYVSYDITLSNSFFYCSF